MGERVAFVEGELEHIDRFISGPYGSDTAAGGVRDGDVYGRETPGPQVEVLNGTKCVTGAEFA